jgi:diketogulonate reductase-like aldo/keto reductase
MWNVAIGESIKLPFIFFSLVSMWEIFFHFKLAHLYPTKKLSDIQSVSDTSNSTTMPALAAFSAATPQHFVTFLIHQTDIQFMLSRMLTLPKEIQAVQIDHQALLQKAKEYALTTHTTYIDTPHIFAAYLIHWPEPRTRQESWKALEEIYATGRAKSIGVSNYTIKHLEEVKTYATVMPMVNQVEFHPFLYQQELLEYCQKNNIALEAYSPLAHGEKIKHSILKEVADHRGKSSAQVMLRWSLQHGNIVLPKSVTPERIKENFEVFDFELAPEEMMRIDGLHEDLRTCWDPSELV